MIFQVELSCTDANVTSSPPTITGLLNNISISMANPSKPYTTWQLNFIQVRISINDVLTSAVTVSYYKQKNIPSKKTTSKLLSYSLCRQLLLDVLNDLFKGKSICWHNMINFFI